MVDDKMIPLPSKSILLLLAFIAGPKSEVTHYQVMRVKIDLIIPDADAVAGSSLPGNSEIWIGNLEFRFEGDISRNPKNHRARSLGHASRPKTTRPAVVEICD